MDDVREEEIRFAGEGTTLEGVLFRPDAGPTRHPAVIIVHEAEGLSESIKDIARTFASNGYVALAVDLFTGRSKAMCMAKVLVGTIRGDQNGFGTSDVKAAIGVLQSQAGVDPERIGIVGFCLGGGLAINVAITDGRVKVIAPFYGANPSPLEAVRRACPVVGSYPRYDFTARSGRRLRQALESYGIANDIKVYDGARHSFMHPSSRAYDPVIGRDAMDRVFRFFARYLGPTDENGLPSI